MKNFPFPVLRCLRLLAVFLGLTAAVFGAKDKPVVGFSFDTLKEERWQHDRDTLEAKVKSLGGSLVAVSANGDDSTQVRDIESLITKGVDVLVIVAHNGEALKRAVGDAKAAGIPVIAYDRLILDCDVDLYVTFDNVKVGALQAQYTVDHLPAGRMAKIVTVYGAPTDNNAKLVKEGQHSVLDPLVKAGKIQIVHADWAADWSPANGKKIVNAAITKAGHDIDAVIASADGVAGGCVQALVEEKLAGRVIVTGQDAELAACQRILRGTQTMTVYKPLQKLADFAGQAAIDLAKGKKVATTTTLDNRFKKVPSAFLDVVTVDKDNLMATVVADGFQKAADLK